MAKPAAARHVWPHSSISAGATHTFRRYVLPTSRHNDTSERKRRRRGHSLIQKELRFAMASPQTLEALAAWARTFDGSENATAQTLSKDPATAFSTISDAVHAPQPIEATKAVVRPELSRDVSSLIDGRPTTSSSRLLWCSPPQGSQRAPHHHYYGTGRHCTIRTHDFSPKYHAYDGPSAVLYGRRST